MNPWRIRRLETTSSTNDDAKSAAEAGEAEGLVIHALSQTAGRGRHGRAWHSPEGNLYCSVLLRPKDTRHYAHYGFVASLALADTVRAFLPSSKPLSPQRGEREGPVAQRWEGEGGSPTSRFPPHPVTAHGMSGNHPLPPAGGEGCAVTLKWPNDVLADGKKISGILLEAGEEYLVIGMGLNIRHHPDDAMYPATSLYDILSSFRGELLHSKSENPESRLGSIGERTNGIPDKFASAALQQIFRNDVDIVDNVLETLLTRLQHWLEILQQHGFTPIRAAWLEQAQKGPLSVRLPNGSVAGDFKTIDDEGRLTLRLADGAERVIATGDVFFAPKE